VSKGKLEKELHYLTPEEEKAIKRNIPWERLDRDAVEVVRLANSVKGIATVLSCAGHFRPRKKEPPEGFDVVQSMIALRATEKMTDKILFEYAPRYGIKDAQVRYFNDGTFWIALLTHPTEKGNLITLFHELKKEASDE